MVTAKLTLAVIQRTILPPHVTELLGLAVDNHVLEQQQADSMRPPGSLAQARLPRVRHNHLCRSCLVVPKQHNINWGCTTRIVLLAWDTTNLAWSCVQAVMLVMGAPRRGRNCFTSVPRCHTTCTGIIPRKCCAACTHCHASDGGQSRGSPLHGPCNAKSPRSMLPYQKDGLHAKCASRLPPRKIRLRIPPAGSRSSGSALADASSRSYWPQHSVIYLHTQPHVPQPSQQLLDQPGITPQSYLASVSEGLLEAWPCSAHIKLSSTAHLRMELTRTASWPPDSRNLLSREKQSAPTACACQCTVVLTMLSAASLTSALPDLCHQQESWCKKSLQTHCQQYLCCTSLQHQQQCQGAASKATTTGDSGTALLTCRFTALGS